VVASVTLLIVAVAVVAVLLVMFAFMKCVVGLLLHTRVRVAIFWEITLLVLLLVVLGELIWVSIFIWLLLAVMGCLLLMFHGDRLALASLSRHLVVVLMRQLVGWPSLVLLIASSAAIALLFVCVLYARVDSPSLIMIIARPVHAAGTSNFTARANLAATFRWVTVLGVLSADSSWIVCARNFVANLSVSFIIVIEFFVFPLSP